jgi:hypothetical protein
MYREVLYLFLQRFVYLGQMSAFGSITNPVGCAVAYRRQYVNNLFDKYGPVFGDDLTNSEDIFIGFALLNEGYRNIQLTDVYARTVEPEVQRLPRQIYLWSSSFLQCCYYFDDLMRSAPRGIKVWFAKRRNTPASKPVASPSRATSPTSVILPAGDFALAGAGLMRSRLPSKAPVQRPASISAGSPSLPPVNTEPAGIERRRIAEPYRQPFGVAHTRRFGRPMGWILLTSLFEKIAFPTTLTIMIILAWWEPLVVTILGETAVSLFALVLVARGQRLEFFFKGLAVVPLRYSLLAYDLVTIGRFANDLWISKNRRWRK